MISGDSNPKIRCTVVVDEKKSRLLPLDFVPGPNHVICARGRQYWNHKGNRSFRAMIGQVKTRYSKATTKADKTMIVSRIVESIINSGGGFVKVEKDGRWSEVVEHYAREKVSQSLRDHLHDQYKSSTRAKRSRKAIVSERIDEDVFQIIHSNAVVSQILDKLKKDVAGKRSREYDDEVFAILSRANIEILDTIKNDKSLVRDYILATTATSNDSFFNRSND